MQNRERAPCQRGAAQLLLAKRDFDFSKLEQQQWSFRFHPQHSDGLKRNRNALPIPALRGAYQLGNAACALAVVEWVFLLAGAALLWRLRTP